jgi:hypothetical protein
MFKEKLKMTIGDKTTIFNRNSNNENFYFDYGVKHSIITIRNDA